MNDRVNAKAGGRSLAGITLTALFAALIAAGAFIAIPLPFSPVPVVLQNLFAVLAGLVLGPFLGSASAALYLLAGALGAPVFAGALGGAVHFAGPTGGFLAGYLLAAAVAGFIAGKPGGDGSARSGRIIPAVILGFAVVYLPGILRLKMVLGTSWAGALFTGCIPFLPGDLLKGIAAAAAAPRLRRAAGDLLDRERPGKD
ncbi:MAG: biotin transporter BioY [Treponema sp.]|jgi:biotin transport system substrate-specific component|nr:biotin transporter BioY [Treponema sp.]